MTLQDIWSLWNAVAFFATPLSIIIWLVIYFNNRELIRTHKTLGDFKRIDGILQEKTYFQVIAFLYIIPWLWQGVLMLTNNNFQIMTIIAFFSGAWCIGEIGVFYEILKTTKEKNLQSGLPEKFFIPESMDNILGWIVTIVSGCSFFLIWVFSRQNDPMVENELEIGLAIIVALALGSRYLFERWLVGTRERVNAEYLAKSQSQNSPPHGSAGWKPAGNSEYEAEFEFSEDAFSGGRQHAKPDYSDAFRTANEGVNRNQETSEDPFFHEQQARKEREQAEQKRRNEEWERNVQRERQAKQEKEHAEKERQRKVQEARQSQASKPMSAEERDAKNGRFVDSRFDTPRRKERYKSALKATRDESTNPSEAGRSFTYIKQADQGMQKGIKPWKDPEL